jgi:hypothetical protein
MADVTYKSEPTVSVHGVPQSQYDQNMAQGQQPGGGGIVGNIKQHWPVWTVGIGIATIVVIYLVYRAQSNSAVNNPASSTTGTTAGSSSPDQLWGSQLDADYQQMISSLNTNTGLLQQILTAAQTPGPTGPTGPPGIQGPPGPITRPPVDPPVPIPGKTIGLMGTASHNTWPTNWLKRFGGIFTIAGKNYEVGPGLQGREWGVLLQKGQHPLNESQWNAAPKTLLIGG